MHNSSEKTRESASSESQPSRKDPKLLDYIINHVAFPLKLPQTDEGLFKIEGDAAICDLIVNACCKFRKLCGFTNSNTWTIIHETVRTFQSLHSGGILTKASLIKSLTGMQQGGVIVIHIKMQNAGLVIHRIDDEYHIEAFEASADAKAVLASRAALRMNFPAHAVAIPATTFADHNFIESFAQFLESGSLHTIKQFSAKTFKAMKVIDETRDTPKPTLITDILMAILEANGHLIKPSLTCKRVHDDVCWSQGSELPWRRSSIWLVLRVGIQRALCFILGGDAGLIHYKFFTAFVLREISIYASVSDNVKSDVLAFINTKLSRRLTKLQCEREKMSALLQVHCDSMSSNLSAAFKSSLNDVYHTLAKRWSTIQSQGVKKVPKLPQKVDPQECVLSLKHSRKYLTQVCERTNNDRSLISVELSKHPRITLDNLSLSSNIFATGNDLNDLLNLAEFESLAPNNLCKIEPSASSREHFCKQLQDYITCYLTAAASAYNGDPIQSSIMILTIMEMWIKLDKIVLDTLPLLKQYPIDFPHDMFHVLQIAGLEDMNRLHEIEQYMDARRKVAIKPHRSIFAEPAQNSFQLRYFDSEPEMQRLHLDINQEAEREWLAKQNEWQRKMNEYKQLKEDYDNERCIEDKETRKCLWNRCTKHLIAGQMRELRIHVYEKPLPDDLVLAKTAIFELCCPRTFQIWRDTTWTILRKLRRSKQPLRGVPCAMLLTYSGLMYHNKAAVANINLGSHVKSFMASHHSAIQLPVEFEAICQPCPLKFSQYDSEAMLWTSEQDEIPSLVEICRPRWPINSSFESHPSITDALHPVNGIFGTTSNKIVAGQNHCPRSLAIKQYIAFQELRLGVNLPWPRLLRELISPNLDFGDPACSILISQAALQVGPPEIGSHLRTPHWVFGNEDFCQKLAKVIERRLHEIAANWRECRTLDSFVTLLLRLRSLATVKSNVDYAERLLLHTRNVSFNWARTLLCEVFSAATGTIAQKRAEDAVLASLLCRRTFAIEVDSGQDLDAEHVSIFIQCSIILHETQNEHYNAILTDLRNKLAQDINLVHKLESKIRTAMISHQMTVGDAISKVWPQADGSICRGWTEWQFLECPENMWIRAETNPQGQYCAKEVHYNILDGNLLIDGRNIGKLPEVYSTLNLYKELFANHIFWTFPSDLPGCTHVAATLIKGHTIHFGMSQGKPFARVVNRTNIFELVSPGIFKGSITDDPDLPRSLIDESVHWLDPVNNVLEIRPMQDPWQHNNHNWTLDLGKRLMQRGRSALVDPRSSTFRIVTELIEPFQDRKDIVLYQPCEGQLSLTLPRLELKFSVNDDGLFQSRQLRAVIDCNQDCGTLYGFESKLVLHETNNVDNRSILAAYEGAIEHRSNGSHVTTVVREAKSYCRFIINSILGRLECPSEPRLLYLKAYYHAITSFVLPDPLTGRTGTREALSHLQSGAAQPWTLLDQSARMLLVSIAELTPQRSYYPTSMQVMQRVAWSSVLTPSIQHDGYYFAVKKIWDQCTQLQRFYTDKSDDSKRFGPMPDVQETHLLQRALQRTSKYQAMELMPKVHTIVDDDYLPRVSISSASYAKALDISCSLEVWSKDLTVVRDLVGLLQRWPLIQGHRKTFDVSLFSELLDLDIASRWGSLFEFCKTMGRKDNKFGLMFFFALLAYNEKIDQNLLRTLVAFCIIDQVKTLDSPRALNFKGFQKHELPPTTSILTQLMKKAHVPYHVAEPQRTGSNLSQIQWSNWEAGRNRHASEAFRSAELLSTHLLSRWPALELHGNDTAVYSQLDVEAALDAIRPEWNRLVGNFELLGFSEKLQTLLQQCNPSPSHLTCRSQTTTVFFRETGHVDPLPCLKELLDKTKPNADSSEEIQFPEGLSSIQLQVEELHSRNCSQSVTCAMDKSTEEIGEIEELEKIVTAFQHSRNSRKSIVRERYTTDLNQSIKTFRDQKCRIGPRTAEVSPVRLDAAIENTRIKLDQMYQQICLALSQDLRFQWLHKGQLWPQLTNITLLETLRKSAGVWQNPLILHYAKLINLLQQLLRTKSNLQGSHQTLKEGDGNYIRKQSWEPSEYPDWLLFEIEFNLQIRPIQHEVAKAMIAPASGTNAVYQMNMGQGKSSVIIPMLAALLADGNKLVRIVITKPLLYQMASLLTSRLGGLIGRTIKHVPFSRESSTKPESIKVFLDLHQRVLRKQGIMLVLPEHLLSFKLGGIQCLSDGKIDDATTMISTQTWFEDNARDVLDECDHILAVRTQLIYPSGCQNLVDGHPQRWTTMQSLLMIVKDCIPQLYKDLPECLEVVEHPGNGFPSIFILRTEVRDKLLKRIVERICTGQGYVAAINQCSEEEIQLVRQLLTQEQLDDAFLDASSTLFKNRPSLKNDILLLRGLLVQQILLTGLNKRYNVQYGLHPYRDPVAVPFHAKGVPSERAEFGHPDVALILTCLSFYYGGLQFGQFKDSLIHLSQTDEPSVEYAQWIEQSSDVPSRLRSWNAVNVEDGFQCDELWKLLRLNMPTINFFLNHFVFPRHAKVFEKKLVSSGWDIPLFTTINSTGQQNIKVMQDNSPRNHQNQGHSTGFSGTNDNRYLLPMNIQQQTIDQLSSTNAEVLTYILQKRNRTYIKAADNRGKRLTEQNLLEKLKDHKIRMLIDAGAQILEMDNRTLASTWLHIDLDAEAAVYFGSDEKIWAVFRDGHKILLAASPFLNNLGNCLVYLDESHTRGTDLKLPVDTVAALTLGPGQTKDHTVQAAMRLRQLGTTQSVVFLAPPEVDRSIRDVVESAIGLKLTKECMDSSDVLMWLLEQTCINLELLQPLYVAQGSDYCHRSLAAYENPHVTTDEHQRTAYLKLVEQVEDYTLANMYMSKNFVSSHPFNASCHPNIAKFMDVIGRMRRNLPGITGSAPVLAFAEVEQERAQEQEVQQERQMPPMPKPLPQPNLHPHVKDFALTGRLVCNKKDAEITQAFRALGRIAIGQKYGINKEAMIPKIFVTRDFMHSIEQIGKQKDEYQKSVTFVLWNPRDQTALIVSPFEAEKLLPLVRDASDPSTYMITYAAPVTHSMLAFNNLDLFIVPSPPKPWNAPGWLKRDLGIFAGRLYFELNEYAAVSKALGLQVQAQDTETQETSVTTGTIIHHRDESISPHPLLLMREWLAIRRNGQEFALTPMGYLCAGRKLREDSAFFVSEGGSRR